MKIYSFLLLFTLFISHNFTIDTSTDRQEKFIQLYKIKTEDRLKKENIKNLIHYAKMCQAAFKSDEHIHNLYPEVTIINGTKYKSKAFIKFDHENQHQDIIIRGSDNFKNWIENAKIFKRKDRWARGVKTHIGFHNTAKELLLLVKEKLNRNYTTTVSGHSLGGSTAVLLGLYLEHFKFEKVNVLSFGQPRITNKKGAHKLLDFPVKRVIHEDDIVTKLVPKALSYRHFGQLFTLSGYKFAKDSFVEPNNVDSERVTKAWSQLEAGEIEVQTNFKSHNIINYLKRLHALSTK
ncbi:MAG: lipase family protein [Candidatus Cloacimonetes bacterium]|nr:lipase family protein [Candidatus Cloacimonadota bacterium]